MAKIIYRADGGRHTGMGHLVRGMAIAERITEPGLDFIFACRDIHSIPAFLRNRGYRVREFPPHATSLEEAWRILSMEPVLVINDIQDTPVEYMKALKEAGIGTINFDDTGKGAGLADVLIDANIPQETLYVLNGGPKRYYGRNYIVIKKEFSELREQEKTIRDKVENVLVIMGGSDPCNLTERIILSLDSISPAFKVTAVAGYGYHKREILQDMATRREWLKVEDQPVSLAGMMHDADIAFSSGGITMFELACMGIPNIVLCQAPHEISNVEPFVNQGIVESLGMGSYAEAGEIAECFNNLAQSPEYRQRMSRSGREYIDGRGLDRIAGIIEQCVMQYSS